ncbi:2335_t:CDS:2, partial [Acaulospora morrowiae]
GTKTVMAPQKSELDPLQLWRCEDGGFLINKKTNLCLEAENGKAGTRLILHSRRSQPNNQRWNLTSDGRIVLQSNPKFVMETKGTSIILSDSQSKSFAKSSQSSKWTIVPLVKKKSYDGPAIGIIRLELLGAKDLKKVDAFIRGGKSDPYVNVYREGSKDIIISQTRYIENELNPVWNEVHYLPIRNIGEKFILDLMDYNNFARHRPLGNCTLEITREIVKEVSGVFEGTNVIDKWVNLSTQGQLHYRVKFYPLTPLPEPSPDFLANLKEKPFDLSTLYVLVTLQEPNGSFPPSGTLANMFGYHNSDELLELYRRQCREERILKINHSIWTTSMILWFLRYLLKDFRNEWKGIYDLATGRKAVLERFDIDDAPRPRGIDEATVRKIIKCRHKNGSYQITDELAKLLDFGTAEKLRESITIYIQRSAKTEDIKQLDINVLNTILVIYFYRYVAFNHKKEWIQLYDKSYEWLCEQFKGKELIEQDVFDLIKTFVREHYKVKEEVLLRDRNFEREIAQKVANIKHQVGTRGIVKKLLGVARIEIISAKGLKQVDTWLGGGSSDPYAKISNVTTGLEYGETRVIYNNLNPVWNQVFYIPVYDLQEKFKIHVYDYNLFFKHASLGFYVIDPKDIVKVLADGSIEGKGQLKFDADLLLKGKNQGKLAFVTQFYNFSESDLRSIQITTTTITISHLYLLLTYQLRDGSFEFTDSLASFFNFSSKQELIDAFANFVQNDEGVRSLDKKTWSTSLIISFLKALLWKHRLEWMEIYNKGEAWLSENIADLDVEERLGNSTNRFVIQHFNVNQWESDEQQRALGVLVVSKKSIILRRHVTSRIVRRFLTYKKESGCFELNNKLAESLGFSSIEEAKKHLETHFATYSKSVKLDVHIWSTAISIWYIRLVLIDFRGEWAETYQKSNDWICEQVQDVDVRKELLEAARIFVIRRFEVDQTAIDEDSSFQHAIDTKDVERPVDVENDDEVIATDEVVGILRVHIESARNLRKSSSWFTSSKPDPYVRIISSSAKEIARTSVKHETVNPIWNEIYYVPIYSVNERVFFEIYDENIFVKDKPLGNYTLEAGSLIKRKDDGSIETKKFDEWVSLKEHKGNLHMIVQFFSAALNEEESFIFSRESIQINHIYVLISWRLA